MVKRKRGRPIGGKAPAPVREWWRTNKQLYRMSKRTTETVTGRRK